ncbi:uncharacterized protein Fot_03182 [Forsythia ovata]|uniref:Uncharacterized protein n=1 Tax=Forsythia ovata TaxID=205694 RepID=A0ABD1XBZ6_9LAMI
MDGKRITARPRPCSGRRVVEKKPWRGDLDGFVNSVKKLQRKEISSKRYLRFLHERCSRADNFLKCCAKCSGVPLVKSPLKAIEFLIGSINWKVVVLCWSVDVKGELRDEWFIFRKWIVFRTHFPTAIWNVLNVNGSYSAQDCIFKVFDLKNYPMLYSSSDENVEEIKISPGIMLLIFTKASSHVPLKILSIEYGTVLESLNHLLHRTKKVDCIELFIEKLLSSKRMRTSRLLLNRTVTVWNLRGELVTSFEDHLLWHSDCNTNYIYITRNQDLIISYCKADSDVPLSDGNGTYLLDC